MWIYVQCSPQPQAVKLIKCYKRLIVCLPEFKEWLSNSTTDLGKLDTIVQQIRFVFFWSLELSSHWCTAHWRGWFCMGRWHFYCQAQGSEWLTELDLSNAKLSAYDKAECGFHNETAGMLLCPVDYDWDNPEYSHTHTIPQHLTCSSRHKANIHDWHRDFLVIANLWP